jgi:hypothetical protein
MEVFVVNSRDQQHSNGEDLISIFSQVTIPILVLIISIYELFPI